MSSKSVEIPEKFIIEAVKEKLGIRELIRYKFFRGKNGKQFLRLLDA